jgi:UPF0755 protein
MKNKVLFFVMAGLFFLITYCTVRYEITSSHGAIVSSQVIEIATGDTVFDVADHLEKAGVISWQGYFVVYIWQENLRHSLIAGKYQVNGAMTIPEIASIITSGKTVPKGVSVVFPEGFGSQKMTDRLTANNLPGDAFLELVNHPKPEWKARFWFLNSLPESASLEGFLFPDTYTFSFEISAEDIIVRMLSNFENKFPDTAKTAISQQNKSIFDIVTLASIVENEVQTSYDRRMVADIFWRRLAIDQPLQSDATVKYVNKKNEIQHSFEETRVDSPYNTYIHKGLPPGPISNPGLDAILAVITPTSNQYFYFLSDITTHETVFSTTFDEHILNKTKHGL